MIQFKTLRQYTHKVNGIRFPKNTKKPVVILYFSENSTFVDDYPKLNLLRIDFRHVIVPVTKIPISRIQSEEKKGIKELGLMPLSSTQKMPPNNNIVYDMSKFLNVVDDTYKTSHYRQRSGFLIKNLIDKIFQSFPDHYEKILMYSVDITKSMNKFVNRKAFPMLLQLKEGNYHYDHLIMNLIGSGSSSYTLLVKNKDFKFNRVKLLLKNITKIDVSEEVEDMDINSASDMIVNKISKNIQSKNKRKITNAIRDFISADKETKQKIERGIELSKDEIKDIAISSMLYKTDANVKKSKRIAKSISSDRKSIAIKTIDKKYVDELLEPTKASVTSDVIATQLANIPQRSENKSPEHLFNKRKIDFQKNLQNDLKNSFNVLSNKDIPLSVRSIDIVTKPEKAGELDKSDISIVKIVLKGDEKDHEVRIQIPKISEGGTFRVNGRKKALINQMVLCPITFPKPYDSKFESSYSAFHIQSKRTKREKHLEIYMGGYKLPLLLILFFSFGFDKTLKQYGLKYRIVTDKPAKDVKYTTRISTTEYIIFENVDSEVKEELCQSYVRHDYSQYEVKEEFKSKLYFNKLIISMTGRVNSTYLLQSNLENIVDPIVKQVLINKRQPSVLDLIMKYMANKVVTGYKDARNDVSNQRIRNSEVIVHLIQKQILAAHTEYKEKVMSGNKLADFEISETKLMSEFLNSEIVTDMEYANPIEEMATLTRTSPVGKTVGGIPDKGAITMEGRDVHPSMFGNIDPLDTPEGENVGMVQHLTVGAMITSSRGIISQKQVKNGEDSGLLSTSAALIPFIENDDGARVMFGCNQARQAIPLKNPSPPIVQSGYESLLTNVLSDAYIKKAPCTGKVVSVTDDYITFQCSKGGRQKVDISPIHLRSGSGKDTLSVFKAKVKAGQSVKEGQIVAEGSCIADGSIALGRTLCVALMPYKGYNFEDGIVISDALVKSGSMTSLHGVEEEVLLSKDDRLLFIAEKGKSYEKGDPILRKSIGEIEQLIGYEEADDEDIAGGQFIKKAPGGKIVDIEVFSNLPNKFPELAPLAEKTRKKYGLKPNEKFSIRKQTIKGVLIRFKIEQELAIGVGDKLTNRHGAKGIVSLIEKEENMPLTPWGDRVELIANPIGVINRMNMGQFYELYTGLIAKELAKRMIALKDKKKIVVLLKSVMPILDNSPNKKFSNSFISGFSALSTQKFNLFMKQVTESKSMPIVISAFKAPSNKDIMKAMKVLGLKSGYKLKLPEYNTKTKSDVSVGYVYYLKLEHLGSEKIHSRSTGPVTGKTGQPTAGKRREGGQRMGELDTYSLISYNCPTMLSEFFGPLSDDHVTKNEMISEIVQSGSTNFKEAKTSPTKNLLNAYFMALMLGKE